MKIENKEQADAAVEALTTWLHALPQSGSEYDDGHPVDMARDYCKDILDAVRADGMGGCPLCQS